MRWIYQTGSAAHTSGQPSALGMEAFRGGPSVTDKGGWGLKYDMACSSGNVQVGLSLCKYSQPDGAEYTRTHTLR